MTRGREPLPQFLSTKSSFCPFFLPTAFRRCTIISGLEILILYVFLSLNNYCIFTLEPRHRLFQKDAKGTLLFYSHLSFFIPTLNITMFFNFWVTLKWHKITVVAQLHNCTRRNSSSRKLPPPPPPAPEIIAPLMVAHRLIASRTIAPQENCSLYSCSPDNCTQR